LGRIIIGIIIGVGIMVPILVAVDVAHVRRLKKLDKLRGQAREKAGAREKAKLRAIIK
jgi:hypothetical protein